MAADRVVLADVEGVDPDEVRGDLQGRHAVDLGFAHRDAATDPHGFVGVEFHAGVDPGGHAAGLVIAEPVRDRGARVGCEQGQQRRRIVADQHLLVEPDPLDSAPAMRTPGPALGVFRPVVKAVERVAALVVHARSTVRADDPPAASGGQYARPPTWRRYPPPHAAAPGR
jgi:hypothetical protein